MALSQPLQQEIDYIRLLEAHGIKFLGGGTYQMAFLTVDKRHVFKQQRKTSGKDAELDEQERALRTFLRANAELLTDFPEYRPKEGTLSKEFIYPGNSSRIILYPFIPQEVAPNEKELIAVNLACWRQGGGAIYDSYVAGNVLKDRRYDVLVCVDTAMSLPQSLILGSNEPESPVSARHGLIEIRAHAQNAVISQCIFLCSRQYRELAKYYKALLVLDTINLSHNNKPPHRLFPHHESPERAVHLTTALQNRPDLLKRLVNIYDCGYPRDRSERLIADRAKAIAALNSAADKVALREQSGARNSQPEASGSCFSWLKAIVSGGRERARGRANLSLARAASAAAVDEREPLLAGNANAQLSDTAEQIKQHLDITLGDDHSHSDPKFGDE